MGGTSGPSGDIWGGLKNPPRKSAGCDKPATITNGKKTITSGGMQREYVIDIPANYDPATPYRLLYVGHGIPGMASDVPPSWWAWKSVATAANVAAIWIAPGALNGVRGAWSTADNRDHVLFDDILAAAEAGLCVDTTRVFAMGMSGGGMLTNALTSDRQNKIRAGVAMAPTNFNIWLPNPAPKDPVAWMQTTGMSDNTCAWVANEAQMRGAKFIGLAKAANNGCTSGGNSHLEVGPSRLLRLRRMQTRISDQGLHVQRPSHPHGYGPRLQRELDRQRGLGFHHAVLISAAAGRNGPACFARVVDDQPRATAVAGHVQPACVVAVVNVLELIRPNECRDEGCHAQ